MTFPLSLRTLPRGSLEDSSDEDRNHAVVLETARRVPRTKAEVVAALALGDALAVALMNPYKVHMLFVADTKRRPPGPLNIHDFLRAGVA